MAVLPNKNLGGRCSRVGLRPAVKPPDKPKTREMLATELSDLLYIIFVLAEHYGVELNESFPQTVNGYMRRFTKNRSQDS